MTNTTSRFFYLVNLIGRRVSVTNGDAQDTGVLVWPESHGAFTLILDPGQFPGGARRFGPLAEVTEL